MHKKGQLINSIYNRHVPSVFEFMLFTIVIHTLYSVKLVLRRIVPYSSSVTTGENLS